MIFLLLQTYLCVPETQSLAEGHCRIVPIHHCVSSTTCDEDIWNEVQVSCLFSFSVNFSSG